MSATRAFQTPKVTNATIGSVTNVAGSFVFNTDTNTLQYLNNSGTAVSVASASGFVPYTGASSDLNLGAHQFLSTKSGSLTNINNSAFLAKGTTPALSLWDTSSGSFGGLLVQDGDFTEFLSAPYAGGTAGIWLRYTATSGQVDLVAGSTTGSGTGGNVEILAGSTGNSGKGGDIIINPGNSGTSSIAGNTYIRGGTATTGTQGAIFFDQGFVNISSITPSSLVWSDATSDLQAATLGSHLSLSGAGQLSTDATNANTASTIVARDGSGNFSAGTITATITGTATNATNVATTQVSTNASYFPLFVASSTNGNQACDLGTGLTFNPSTNVLTTTTFSGALSGTATNATNIAITDDTTTNATMNLAWVTSNTGNLPAKVSSTKLNFNPSTGALLISDGSASNASYGFINDPDCGMYRIGTNNIGITIAGTNLLNLSTGKLRPEGSSSLLGDSSNRWSTVYGVAGDYTGIVTCAGVTTSVNILASADNTVSLGSTTNRFATVTAATVRNYANADSTHYGNGSTAGFGFPDGYVGLSMNRLTDAGATFATQRWDLIVGSPAGGAGNATSNSLFVYDTTSSVNRTEFTHTGSVVINNAAIATNATDGFLYIASCAGTPTGTPTAFTGRVAMVYDTTNNKFYVYNGAWKGVTLT